MLNCAQVSDPLSNSHASQKHPQLGVSTLFFANKKKLYINQILEGVIFGGTVSEIFVCAPKISTQFLKYYKYYYLKYLVMFQKAAPG